MRMKEDNMKNGQLKADYNLQVATNSQYILDYDLFPNPTDTRTLRPFLMTLKEHFFELPTYIVADAGYGGEENYQAVLEDSPHYVCYVSWRTKEKIQIKSVFSRKLVVFGVRRYVSLSCWSENELSKLFYSYR